MGKNELSEAGTSTVRDNMANFGQGTRKTWVTGYPGGKACIIEEEGCEQSRRLI